MKDRVLHTDDAPGQVYGVEPSKKALEPMARPSHLGSGSALSSKKRWVIR